MKNTLILIFLVFVIVGCKAQTKAPDTKFYNAMFKWHTTIPGDFTIINKDEFAKIQKKGQDAIEQTLDGKIDNQAKQIFVVKSDQFHYMEANYQPYDVATKKNYFTTCKAVGDVIMATFTDKMPGVKIDTNYTNEVIDKLTFSTFKTIIQITPSKQLNMYMFSRLFDNGKEFSMVMMFMDKDKGQLMLDAWRKSKFDK